VATQCKWQQKVRAYEVRKRTTQSTKVAIYLERNIVARSRNRCRSGKAISTKHYECVCLCVFLPYLYCKRSACAILHCHLWPVRPYHNFPHYVINGTILGKELLKRKYVSWLSLQLLPETFPVLRTKRSMIKSVHWSSCKYPLFFSDLSEIWIFFGRF